VAGSKERQREPVVCATARGEEGGDPARLCCLARGGERAERPLPEQRRAAIRHARAANPERFRVAIRRREDANRERLEEATRRWYAAYRDAVIARSRCR
jgi:hypothetical protein